MERDRETWKKLLRDQPVADVHDRGRRARPGQRLELVARRAGRQVHVHLGAEVCAVAARSRGADGTARGPERPELAVWLERERRLRGAPELAPERDGAHGGAAAEGLDGERARSRVAAEPRAEGVPGGVCDKRNPVV